MSHPDIAALIDQLAAIPATDSLFNPYGPPGDPAADIRRANLSRYLTRLRGMQPRAFLLAEAPGYRGCRWSGIPVTSERIMLARRDRWGLFEEGFQPTSGQPDGVAEMSATILWEAINAYCDLPPVIWNSAPLHPHKSGQPDSNRTPTPAEQRMGAAFIEPALALFPSIDLILAVGRTAQRALDSLGRDYVPLRHPSQGGKAEFVTGLREAMGKM